MLFAASESAVTKKPRLRVTMRRSSSVRPRGSFHSWMSRLMLISCGIQWLAQAARYFSQAHLYLNGTSWLRSALELITRLSSTVTRRKAFPAGASSSFCAAPEGTKPVVGWIARPGMGGVREIERVKPASSSKLSMGLSSCGGCGQGEQFFVSGCPLGLGRVVHLAGGDVEVPFAAGERHPVAVLRMLPDQPRHGEVGGVAEVHRVEHEQAPSRDHHRVEPRRPRRRPQAGDEGARELTRAERDHWHASQSGFSIEHTFGSSAVGTALSWPALVADFWAWVAPIARGWWVVFGPRSRPPGPASSMPFQQPKS